MAEMNPFDPATWGQAASNDDAAVAALDAHLVQATLMAEMALMFLHTLEQHHLSHADALYLTAHVWRAG